MKCLTVLLLATLLFTIAGFTGPVTVPDSEVTFQPPEGFTNLTAAEISLKFPQANAPKHVVGNPRRTTTIVYEYLPKPPFPPEQLDAFRKALPRLLVGMVPGAKWTESKIIDLAGQKWAYLEGTHDVLDGKAHDIFLITSHNGQMLKFQLGTMETEFASQEKALRACIESIKLKK